MAVVETRARLSLAAGAAERGADPSAVRSCKASSGPRFSRPRRAARAPAPRAPALQLDVRQSSATSVSRMTAASLPPNRVENTVMPAKLYSGGASFISLCMVPVRFVASRM